MLMFLLLLLVVVCCCCRCCCCCWSLLRESLNNSMSSASNSNMISNRGTRQGATPAPTSRSSNNSSNISNNNSNNIGSMLTIAAQQLFPCTQARLTGSKFWTAPPRPLQPRPIWCLPRRSPRRSHRTCQLRIDSQQFHGRLRQTRTQFSSRMLSRMSLYVLAGSANPATLQEYM